MYGYILVLHSVNTYTCLCVLHHNKIQNTSVTKSISSFFSLVYNNICPISHPKPSSLIPVNHSSVLSKMSSFLKCYIDTPFNLLRLAFFIPCNVLQIHPSVAYINTALSGVAEQRFVACICFVVCMYHFVSSFPAALFLRVEFCYNHCLERNNFFWACFTYFSLSSKKFLGSFSSKFSVGFLCWHLDSFFGMCRVVGLVRIEIINFKNRGKCIIFNIVQLPYVSLFQFFQ